MKTTIRAAFAALALVPALLLAPAAGAQDADCYPVPPEGCESGTDGGDTDGGDTDGNVGATTQGNTDDGGDTDGGDTDGNVGATTQGNTDDGGDTDGEQPTEVLPTIIDRPDDVQPQPAPEPQVEAAQLPRTGTDAGDWAALAALAIAGGAGAIALTRRETDAVELES